MAFCAVFEVKVAQVCSVDVNVSFRRIIDPAEQLDERRLAGAVHPDDPLPSPRA